MEVKLGVQTNWPSGSCHGCGLKFEDAPRDMQHPYLTLAGVSAPLPDDMHFVLCPVCTSKVSAALARYREILRDA